MQTYQLNLSARPGDQRVATGYQQTFAAESRCAAVELYADWLCNDGFRPEDVVGRILCDEVEEE